MGKNNYRENESGDLLLLMFDHDFNTSSGQAPITSRGMYEITTDEYPAGTSCSAHFRNGFLVYPIPAIGEGDFSVDFWLKYDSGYAGVTSSDVNSLWGIIFNIEGVGIGTERAGTMHMNSENLFSREWAHYALVRKDGKGYCFVNGKLVVQGMINRALENDRFAINTYYTNDYYWVGNAYYKAVRLSNFARWTADFTPPKPALRRNLYLYLSEKYVYGVKSME